MSYPVLETIAGPLAKLAIDSAESELHLHPFTLLINALGTAVCQSLSLTISGLLIKPAIKYADSELLLHLVLFAHTKQVPWAPF